MRTRWRPLPRLLGISPGDHGRGRDLDWVLRGAVAGGLQLLVLREPQLEERELVQLIRRIQPIVGEGLILHTSCAAAVELAIQCKTGLHLKASMDASSVRERIDGWLGQSCHSALELASARANGCDYVTLSPIFRPLSKPDDRRPPVGTAGLTRLCAHTDLPALALGGITPERVADVIRSGAYGIASMGGIFSEDTTPEEAQHATETLIEALHRGPQMTTTGQQA